ncbi:MAG: glycosyltransferase [Salibacteraceae bacterium]
MKVLHITSPKTWRGGEQQLMYLTEELNGLHVWQLILCPFNSAVHRYALQNHLRHATYFKGFSANPLVAYKVRNVCKHFSIDLIHVHDSHAHNFAVLSAAITNNPLPIIVSRRVDFSVSDNRFSAYKYNHPNVKRIICVSEAIRKVMEPSIIDKSKLEVVYSGVDLNKISSMRSGKLRKELGISDQTTLIGNVAALAPHKSLSVFVSCANQLISSGMDAHFVIIGDGPSRAAVERAIAGHNLQQHITLTGFRNDVPEILADFDLYLMTSETEGLGTSLLDAQLAGVPVVTTNAGGIPEIIKHGYNGMVCEVGDVECLTARVVELVLNRTLREELINNGYEAVKKFSKDNTAAKTLKIYREVLEEAGGDSTGTA